MVKVLISDDVVSFIEKSNSGLKNQIRKKFEKLRENPKLGDYVFGINNIDCREIKVEGLRFFTIQYNEQSFVLKEDEFKDLVKVIGFAKKNKAKEQQQIIDDIKRRIKSFGMDF